ncbi:MAG: amidohydrolase family protein [Halieaceae bacterium]|uniref:N-acyl-D-amino-acid deacylase family protein n=1 Tax=Haliea alexandrii TaxID=2448162 RepID=UPI000F0BB1BB|nr:amidohydrolase family protein [Haliea alexandrii]MCR9183947.1 amidohydrolase family protein [Halieaceae bacterium]
MTQQADLVIRNGQVVDGSGQAAFEADVAIRDGRIIAVGPALVVQAAEEIDAAGQLVTPGFVDIHTHYDGQVTWSNSVTPSSRHGVTTVLMGNCGVGFAPCKAGDRQRLVSLMEGVEDLPEVVLTTGLPWTWESFPDYLDQLEQREYDADIATQIPHAALRVFAMGERAVTREAASAEDRACMAQLAAQAINAGALGFATSRTINHRASDGTPIFTLDAAEEELIAIGRALRDSGRGVLQLVSDFTDIDTELAMLRRIAEQTERPLSLTVMQWHNAPDKWRTVLDWVEDCQRDGLPVKAQVSGRPVGILMGFEASFNPFSYTPTFKSLLALAPEERRAALRDPAVRAHIIEETPEPSDFPGEMLLRSWDLMYPLGEQPDYEPDATQRVSAIAARRGISPAACAYDLMLEQDGQAVLMLPVVNFADGTLNAALDMLRHPHSLYGLGDGGAHLGFLCDASLPTHLLTYWARDRNKGERLALPEVIRGLTHDTADAVGLNDRGLLRPGYRADINIIDFEALTLLPPRIQYDLPANGRRVHQDANGYTATLVNGQVVQRNGQATGLFPGRLVRGPQQIAKSPV